MHHNVHVVRVNTSLREALNLEANELLVSGDEMSYGRLLDWKSIGEWQQCRNEYRQSLNHGATSSPCAKSEFDLLDNVDLLRRADSITLWLGTAPDEQLFLVWMVQLLRHLDVATERLKVVQFERVRGFGVLSVGELNPDHLRGYPPPTQLATHQIEEVDRAWRAITAADPGELIALIGEEGDTLPLLHRSLKRLVFRFPSIDSGLNLWEEGLLKCTIEKGPGLLRVIGYTLCGDMELPDAVSDTYLFARLRRLADPSLAAPFVSLSPFGDSLRSVEVRITDTGRKALEGEANFVALNGVDDWIGGVHLDASIGNVWFRRGDTIVRSSL